MAFRNFAGGTFSTKAKDFIRNSNHRLNITHGSVRSSKTVNCSIRWLIFLLEAPPGDLLMAGKTIASLQRNVLNDIFDLVGQKNYRWASKQMGELILMGRRVHIVGASTKEAEEKIRGSTLAGAYCDEVSIFPESFFDMLMTRLSVEGAKCFCTCNPDGPNHWFLKNYINNTKIMDKGVWHFTLDDNPNLGEDYIEFLKQSYTGVFYDRFILGKWVSASGVIYRKFADNPQDYLIEELPNPSDVMFVSIGVDIGGNKSAHTFNATAFLTGFSGVVTIDEYYQLPNDYDASSRLDANDITNDLLEFVKVQQRRGYIVKEVLVDSAEQVMRTSFKNALLRSGLGVPANNARKYPVNDRVQFYNAIIGSGIYKIMRTCTHTISAFINAVWDEDKKLKDVRLDVPGETEIDNLDSQEYSTEKYQREIIRAAKLKAMKGGIPSGSRRPTEIRGAQL